MTDDIALRRAPMEITGAQNPSLRNRLRSYVRRSPRLRAVWDAVKYARAAQGGRAAECPVCGTTSRFLAFGFRANALCPKCSSLERHRVLTLAIERLGLIPPGSEVLHFAPEEPVTHCMRRLHLSSYVTADITPGRAARVLNIEQMALPDASVDVIVCLHVLEHVNDARALAEMRRVLRPHGRALLMVPIVEGWGTTYENAEAARTVAGRIQHFGQHDHIRVYGRDLRDRIRAAGFELATYTGSGADTVRYSLLGGETVFVATKPA